MQVQAVDVSSFLTRYTAVLRSHMTALRPKRRKRAPKKAAAAGAAPTSAKSKAAARATFVFRLPKVIGPRRGAGHEKRQRSVKRRDRELKKLWQRKRREKAERAGAAQPSRT